MRPKPLTARALTLVLALLISAAGALSPQTIDRANGEAGAPILQLTVHPRAAALGGAAAATDGIASVFANPAGLVSLAGRAVHVSGQTLPEDAKAGAAAAGVRMRRLALAVGVRYLDLGSIDEVVCDGCGGRGTPTERTLSAGELALTGAGAISWAGRASVGAALNYYASTVGDASGSALSFSGGVRAPARADATLVFAASVQFIGGDVDIAGFAAPLPRTVRVGGEFRPFVRSSRSLHVALAADYVAVRGAPGRLGGGVELGLRSPLNARGLVGRIGYTSAAGTDFATAAVSVGGGVVVGRLAADYAYQSSEIFGGLHRLGVTIGR